LKNLKSFFTYFRLSIFHALCLLDLQQYPEAEFALVRLTEVLAPLPLPC
jgi:hypothetical protein